MTSTPNATGAKPSIWFRAGRWSSQIRRPLWQQRLKHSDLPILVGPWRGEVALEAIYWIPWVQRLRQELGIDPTRLIPIGRGGSAWWYQVPTGIELYVLRTPQQVRIETKLQHQAKHQLKQIAWTPFERAVVQDAADSINAKRYLTLHPHRMCDEIAPFWEGQRGLAWLQRQLAFAPLTLPPLPATAHLPDQFVAVHFYARSTWPMAPPLIQFATETIKQLSHAQPVVLVGSGLHMDDHMDLPIPPLPNVYTLKDCGVDVTPQTNLALVSAVLGKAAGCLGTYGGTVQLAARLGKPAIGFYDQWQGTMVAHKHLSEALAMQLGVQFLVLKLGDIPLMQAALPRVMLQGPKPGLDIPVLTGVA